MESKRKASTVFLTALIICGLAPKALFAGAAEFKEIQRVEATELPKREVSSIVRPSVEYNAEGLKDPFQGRKEDTKGAASQMSTTSLSSLIVQGVVWGGRTPQAIINNKVVKVGDMIEDARVIDINKEGVTVLLGSQQYNLSAPAASGAVKDEAGGNPQGGSQ